MKLRDKHGELYDIVNIMAVDKDGDLWVFNDGYDLINDIGVRVASMPEKTIRLSAGSAKKEPDEIDLLKQEIRKNSIDINQQLAIIKALLSRVNALESVDASVKNTIVSLLARVAKLETTAGHFNP